MRLVQGLTPGIGEAPGMFGRSFDPAVLGSQLAVWLRADDVVQSGGTISQWNDRSGNGRHFTQALAARQATYTANGIGGQPAGTFDGINDIANGPSFAALLAAGSAEKFAIIRLANDPPIVGFGACWQLGSPAADEEYCPFMGDGKIYLGGFASARKTTNVAKGAGYFSSQPRIVSTYSIANDWRLFLDGVEAFATATNTYAIGGTTAIGGDPEGASTRFAGKIAEVLIFAPMLTAPQRSLVLRYLGGRYSITVP